MSLLPYILHDSLSLLTDFYQLTMAYGYWRSHWHTRRSVFHYFFRKKPFQGEYAVTAGLESLVYFLEKMRFTQTDLDYLAGLKNGKGNTYFEPAFLQFLAAFRFKGDIWAIKEGTVVFPYEPLVRVEATLIECQLIETILLNLMNFPTLIATKAARICHAAGEDPVLEFGLRRAQGVDGAMSASRAAFIGGCSATSNVLAGKMFGIPVQGTHAHSWIMAFGEEKEAFARWADIFPESSLFLVDTYSTPEGIKNAIEVGCKLQREGKEFLGIRLDSGDLLKLSQLARVLLDKAGLEKAHIVASNDLDEEEIRRLKQSGAKISVWGVGTHLVTGRGQPALDGVYKLSLIEEAQGRYRYTLKTTDDATKISLPGRLQIRRYMIQQGSWVDVVYDVSKSSIRLKERVDFYKPDLAFLQPVDITAPYEELLQPIIKEGKLVYNLPSLYDIHSRAKEQLHAYHHKHDKLKNSVYMDVELYQVRQSLMPSAKIR